MAIKHGETLLPEGFRPKVPVVGTVKIGDVSASGSSGKAPAPVKLDHFRYCKASPSRTGRFEDHPDFAAENARKPKSVKIELVSDDPAMNLELGRVMAGRGVVLCRGGAAGTAERRMDASGRIDPNLEFMALPDGSCSDACPYAKQKKCKVASTLRFRIPEHTPLGNLWQLRSTSWNTAQGLLGAMEAIKELTGGTLARIPLALTITETRRSVVAQNERTGTTFFTVGMAFDGDEEDLLKALEKAHSVKVRLKAMGLVDVEERLRQQGPTIGHEDEAEAFALQVEHFPEPVPTENLAPATVVHCEAGPEVPLAEPEGMVATTTPGPAGAAEASQFRTLGVKVGALGLEQAFVDQWVALLRDRGTTQAEAAELIRRALKKDLTLLDEIEQALAAVI